MYPSQIRPGLEYRKLVRGGAYTTFLSLLNRVQHKTIHLTINIQSAVTFPPSGSCSTISCLTLQFWLFLNLAYPVQTSPLGSYLDMWHFSLLEVSSCRTLNPARSFIHLQSLSLKQGQKAGSYVNAPRNPVPCCLLWRLTLVLQTSVVKKPSCSIVLEVANDCGRR